MDNDYVAIKRLLDKRNLYYEEDVTDDGKVPFLRCRQTFKNGGTITIAILFEESHVQILFLNIATIDSISKRTACYKLINKFNGSFKLLKFIFNEDTGMINGELSMSRDVYTGAIDANSFMRLLAIFLDIIETDAYPEIMKLQWS